MELFYDGLDPYDLEELLAHSGTPQPYDNSPTGSGRYRKGSGENPYQHESSFLNTVKKLRAEGMSDTEIARAMNMSTTEFRARRSIEKDELTASRTRTATKLYDEGYSKTKIAEMMGTTESNIRNWLKNGTAERADTTMKVANHLMDLVDKKGFIDVGEGVELEFSDQSIGGVHSQFGISKTKLNTAIQIAQDKGYEKIEIHVPQPNNPMHKTTVKVLAPNGTTPKDIWDAGLDKINPIRSYSQDNGKTFYDIEYPTSIDSSRIKIRYGDEAGVSGSDLDGVIQLRRGVQDLSLGNSSYAQVRIAVDGTHFLKGMAIYSDDMPDGYDVVYNTNKKSGTDPYKVFKEMKTDKNGNIDKDNPFGALIKNDTGQYHYIDKKTGEDKLGAINKIKEEGYWEQYSRTLASQFLAKQPTSLIEKQLNLSYLEKKTQFEELNALTNPVVKRKLLDEFASDCDASAEHLKAAALPRQTTKVILPIPSMKDNEIYAPSYKNGEHVALVRYPHGGTFEIPILKVNNKQADAKSLLGNAIDAVGINSKVAEKLSGADFDGDTVVVIPSDKVKISSRPSLKGLENFDPKIYKYPEDKVAQIEALEKKGYKAGEIRKETGCYVLDSRTKGNQMGIVSNLISDMNIKGANADELARAVRHSMVVIDAQKHHLNYKQSEIDNNIAELKRLYQHNDATGKDGGASTLISRAKSDLYVPERKEGVYVDKTTGKVVDKYVKGETKILKVDPITGEKLYRETGRTYINRNGKEIAAETKITKMAGVKDAFELSSGTPVEAYYAKYANDLKALANEARLASLGAGKLKYTPGGKEKYKAEVDSLNASLNLALRNKPRERQAQLIANEMLKMKKRDNPNMSHDEEKKVGAQCLQGARARLGASKPYIEISPKEWEAIQYGAITDSKLTKIINNAKPEHILKLATPKTSTTVSAAHQARIKAMADSGFTISEIAEQMGLSSSTVSKYIK